MADHAGRETQADLLSSTSPSTVGAGAAGRPAAAVESAPLSVEAVAEPISLASLASRLQAAAIARSVSVATAESCTGGLVGHSITEVPGSSGYFRGTVVSYADDLKVRLLGVPEAILERHGAVSAQVAVAMAEGARTVLGATYAVAVTGVAGPQGGTAAKPVGRTYVAAVGPQGHEVRRHTWSGARASNKQDSARSALELLIELIEAPGTADEPPGTADEPPG